MPSAAKSNNDSAVQRPSSLPSDFSGIDSLPKPIEPDADRVRSFNYFEHHILTTFFLRPDDANTDKEYQGPQKAPPRKQEATIRTENRRSLEDRKTE